MGLIRATIIFLIGNFAIKIINNGLDLEMCRNIPIPFVGNILGGYMGEKVNEYLKNNKLITLLIVITIFEFIM